jgi:GTPase SAR1 family protein
MAAEVPTFKLVLVGDGGTGKVSQNLIKRSFAVITIS